MFHSESFEIANQIINQINRNFEEELLIKKLMLHFVQFNQNFVQQVALKMAQSSDKGIPFYCIPGFQLSTKSQKQAVEQMFKQDIIPIAPKIQPLANTHVKINLADYDQYKGLQLIQQQISSQRQRMTSSTFKNTRVSDWLKRQQIPIHLTQPPQPPIPLTNPQDRKSPQQKQAEQKLQQQLNFLKKKLYFTRKVKKQEQQQERIRLENLKKKRSPQLPKSQFTYNYQGQFIKNKNNNRPTQAVSQMSIYTSSQIKQKKPRYLDSTENNIQQLGDTQRSLFSRYKKASVFNNSNQRQISHLPFIKLSSDSKLTQNNKINKGIETSRTNLQSYTSSLDQQGFKHHLQIKRQQRIKQKQKSILDDIQQPLHITDRKKNNNQQLDESGRNKQAYMMVRYLKKMAKDRQKGLFNKLNKSLNFSRLNYTQDTSIYKYYKHDFDQQRRKIYQQQFAPKSITNTMSGKI